MAPETWPLPKYHDPFTSSTAVGSSFIYQTSIGTPTLVGSPTIMGSSTVGGSSREGGHSRRRRRSGKGDDSRGVDSPGMGGSATTESDVYEMALVIYEARSYRSTSSGRKVKSHIGFLGFDGGDTSLRVSPSRLIICRGG